mmetsp:Transcript_96180/g.206380  ORF Transcript_96180/g.206380 Transcript_96180/m.206380 type:complete len:497 (+) Transcript_96180:68-1558(+)
MALPSVLTLYAHVTLLAASLVVSVATDAASLLQTRLETEAAAEGETIREELLRTYSKMAYRQTMYNFADAQYVSDVIVGKQRITGILDTGSFELVVFSGECKGCGVAAHYLPEFSDTFRKGHLIQQMNYGSGGTTCEEASDMVSIGPFDRKNQTFWNVQQANMPLLDHAAFESIIGVGPVQTAAMQFWTRLEKRTDEITKLLERGDWPSPERLTSVLQDADVGVSVSEGLPMLNTFDCQIFSVCNGYMPGTDGVFVWNDYLALEHPDAFVKVDTIQEHPDYFTWSANMTDLALDFPGGDSAHIACENQGCIGLIDSGTSLLLLPALFADRIQAQLSNKLNADCSNLQELPDLTFKLGGKSFTLPPDAYVAKVINDSPKYLEDTLGIKSESRMLSASCQLMVMTSFESNFIILGVPFLRSYYTTFYLGKTEAERAMYMAPADSMCQPATVQRGKFAATSAAARSFTPPLRTIPASRIISPRLAFRHGEVQPVYTKRA